MPSRRRSDSLPKHDPLREAIALHAYERFLARGGVDGRDVEDWLAAERDLLHLRRAAHQTPAGDTDVKKPNRATLDEGVDPPNAGYSR